MEENGRLVQFLFDGDKVVAETDCEGTNIRYIRGYELISSDCEKARTYYHYASDELGSITHITDEAGNVCNHYEYDAFGDFTVREETVANRFGFTGEQYDPVAGLYYLRARFYNPVIGRFIQEDTYYGDGLNLYAYCGNNPVRYVDPSGYAKKECPKRIDLMNKLESMGLSKAAATEFADLGLNKKNFDKLLEYGLDADEAFDFMKQAKSVMNSDMKGVLGEKVMDAIMKKNGYECLPTKLKSNNGIDGIYVKKGPDGKITEVVIGEAKFGSSRLNPVTTMGPQMSKRWIEGNIYKMLSTDAPIEVQKAARKILKYIRTTNYKTSVFRFRASGYTNISAVSKEWFYL